MPRQLNVRQNVRCVYFSISCQNPQNVMHMKDKYLTFVYIKLFLISMANHKTYPVKYCHFMYWSCITRIPFRPVFIRTGIVIVLPSIGCDPVTMPCAVNRPRQRDGCTKLKTLFIGGPCHGGCHLPQSKYFFLISHIPKQTFTNLPHPKSNFH